MFDAIDRGCSLRATGFRQAPLNVPFAVISCLVALASSLVLLLLVVLELLLVSLVGKVDEVVDAFLEYHNLL